MSTTPNPPPFHDWHEDREPNRNRWQRELTKLLIENAEAIASDRLDYLDDIVHGRNPGTPKAPSVEALTNTAAFTALRAEYEATFDTLFPSNPQPEGME